MPADIRRIILEFARDMNKIFDKQLRQVIIYGSYARGDFNENSDVDVMILVSMPEETIRQHTDQVSDCAFDYLMRYGIDISPIVKNEDHFNYWADNLPYYRNVRNEGVIVNG